MNILIHSIKTETTSTILLKFSPTLTRLLVGKTLNINMEQNTYMGMIDIETTGSQAAQTGKKYEVLCNSGSPSTLVLIVYIRYERISRATPALPGTL